MSDDMLMTQEEYDRLKAHAASVQRQLDEALAAMGAGAEADSNTWHDNPAFDEATQKVDMFTTQLGTIKARLSRAVIVDSTKSLDIVGVGSTVTVRYLDDDEPETVRIGGGHVVGGLDRDDGIDVISYNTPLGGALIGRKMGDDFKYVTPKGMTIEGEILEIS